MCELENNELTLRKIYEIENEEERVKAIYELFNEDKRLNISNSTRVEFLTVVNCLSKYLYNGDKILEIGAGTGKYSLYFASLGYSVTSVELSKKNISIFKERVNPNMDIKILEANALDLSVLKSNSYDIVLLFGPLYHLQDIKNQILCIKEAKRVLKDDGKIFATFLNNDMVPLRESFFNLKYFESDNYDHETFDVFNFPYTCHTIEEARNLFKEANLIIKKETAIDGLSRICFEHLNQLDEKNFKLYMKYHLYLCEKPTFIGATSHFMLFAEKCVEK